MQGMSAFGILGDTVDAKECVGYRGSGSGRPSITLHPGIPLHPHRVSPKPCHHSVDAYILTLHAGYCREANVLPLLRQL